MFLADTLTLDAPKRTKEGFLAVRARAARAGIYDYRGCEVDPEGKHFAADQVVKVYRSDAEVFAKEAVHSFLLKPITDDHPKVPVNADNWAQYAKGVNAGALKDGEYLAFDLVLMDAAAIKAVDSGKRELSNGYQSEIVITTDGKAPDGTACDAYQTTIRGNHVALVDKGRAGPECRIGDVATCDAATVELIDRLLADGQTYRPDANDSNFQTDRSDANKSQSGAARRDGEGLMATKQITFDGMPIEATDQAEAAIIKLQGMVETADARREAADAKVVELTTEKTTLTDKVAKLEKALEDAKVTPAKLRDAAKEYQAIVDKAEALGVEVTDEMDEPAIMKAAVTAKLGDTAKDWSAEHIAISFATLTKDVKSDDEQVDPLRGAIRDSAGSKTADKEVKDAYTKMIEDLQKASQPKHLQTATA